MAVLPTSRPSAVFISLAFTLMVNGHYIPVRRRTAIPEIGGSQAGFIGLVVFLSVLIVVCCGAVYYLLRYHEPTDQDRAIRRERSRRRRAETEDPPSEPSFGNKFKRAWERVRYGNGRSGRGWVKAGSGDAWESTPDNGNATSEESGVSDGQMQSVQKGIENTACTTESPLSDSGHGLISALYRDPFNEESPVSQASSMGVEIVRSQSPLSVCSSRNDDETHCRHSSMFSTASGTRFIEHL
ncbi:hypothetical protein EV401DRAFT_1931462 [Pisolithus croceorrhizus]|nr:hypothetical protein EV401DRAFT_1931462 [Pisolithus croceorrhizus]